MKLRTRWSLISLAVLASLGGAWAVFGRSREGEAFTTEAAQVMDLRDKVEANGQIQALTRVNVGSQVTAEIKEIHVKDGQSVQAGDLLVVLDQERVRQDLAGAELALRSAQEDLRNAEATRTKLETTHGRQEALHRQGLISSEDYQTAKLSLDTATTAAQKARVAIRQAEAQVAIARDALAKTVIRAPMAGTITGLKAEKGEMAIAGTTNLAGAVLMVISDLSVILAEVSVGELEVVKLRPGQPAEVQVDAYPGRIFPGQVLEVASSVDATSANTSNQAQNYRVRVRLGGPAGELQGLRPGMSARLAILAGEARQVLTVPLQAIQEKEARTGVLKLMTGSRPIVWVVKDGRAQERELTTGVLTRRAAEVKAGVTAGEQVVTGPPKAMAGLRTGAPVRLQPASLPGGPGK